MIDRRTLLATGALALPAATAVAKAAGPRNYRIIATEEAFAIPEWYAAMDALPLFGPEQHETRMLRALDAKPPIKRGMLDFDYRLQIMDAANIDVHLLSLTTPGVQSLEKTAAVALARLTNDRLAEVIRRHPTRFAGLAAVAPQDPVAAAAEIERAITKLGFNGVLINSYTADAYLDDPKFEAILATIARLGVPLYLHPRVPAPSMVKPYTDYGLLNAMWGFQADTGLHAMRLILSGVFDRHPNLTVVLGHMGEGIPYWFWRIDNMYKKSRAAQGPDAKGLKKLPSEYFRESFYITTSGVNSHANLKFAIDLLGADRIMFAIDFPYESSAESVEFLTTAPIDEAAREKIACRNAERVFKLPTR